MRKVKCKYCNELILDSEDLIVLKEKTKSDKTKNIHLHKQCQKDYIELIEYKENEIKWFNEVYEYIKELLNYDDTQKLPNSLVTRVQDLRNGTVIQKGIGRVIKSKEGYTYKTILNTFLAMSEKIKWALENKDFTSEQNKINYMMVIIDSNINDLVVQENTINNSNNIKAKNNLINDEKDNRIRKKVEYIPQSKGIAKFLDEDDF